MKVNNGRVVLITGGSCGIGREVAIQLGQSGYRVAIAARGQADLDEVAGLIRQAGGTAEAYTCDLTIESERNHLIRSVTEEMGEIDVLINNAGRGWYGFYDEMSWEDTNEILQLNTVALAHLTQLVLGPMKARGSGQILNLGSVVGDLPVQGSAMYSATKAFVDSFTTCVARETRGTGVYVSLIKPGPVRTPNYPRAGEVRGGSPVPVDQVGISVDYAARHIVKAVKHPARLVIIPWYYYLFPAVDVLFGWIFDLLGPSMLK